MHNTPPSPEDPQQDPQYWKWGLFYFNPNDKRLLVPKRVPSLGWTLNFANPYCGLALAATTLLFYVLHTLSS